MSESRRDDVELPEEVEGLLADWPAPERSEADWDALASRTLAAALAGPGAADPSLLEPPLPQGEGEHGDESAESTSDANGDAANESADEAEGLGLAAIARAAVATQSSKEDADLMKESLSVAANARQSIPDFTADEPLDEADEIEDTPLTDVQTVRSGASAAVEAQSPEAARPRVVQLPTPARERSSRRVGLVVAGLMAAAAAVLLVVRAQRPGEPVAMSVDAPGTEPGPAASPRPSMPQDGVAREPEKPASRPPSKDEPAFLALDDLPTEAEAKRRARESKAEPRGNVVASRRAAPPPIALEETLDPAAAAQTEPTQKGGGFEADPAMKPAAQATDLPRRPSTGAVQAAVASVMTGAQMCLAGHEDSAKATLTFGADGKVSAVSVSGPAETCIRAALSRAKVSPFAEPTFSARFTVRPP